MCKGTRVVGVLNSMNATAWASCCCCCSCGRHWKGCPGALPPSGQLCGVARRAHQCLLQAPAPAATPQRREASEAWPRAAPGTWKAFGARRCHSMCPMAMAQLLLLLLLPPASQFDFELSSALGRALADISRIHPLMLGARAWALPVPSIYRLGIAQRC